ncbi:phage holin [Enterococcus sp. BWB1-3]|uniref:phage holin n=1 Tax=Enterococcus sp. BWB1-3 TaxID=2787713 RepID=UPI001922A8D5|nr:phage holin [Enterococcus sp. BWB1-3]MBL1228124.1 phage holin [Enterococcus sp. BWB1-3]
MKNVSASTIARTVVLILALLNQILAVAGKGTLNIVEDDVYQVVSLIFTIGSTAAAWWKNNSFTKVAIEADEALKELKKDGES